MQSIHSQDFTTTGNLSSKAGTSYTYGDTNHDHAVTQAGSNTFAYDANGNMTTRTVGGQTYTLGYDAENRLISVSGAATATFVYDGDGQRVISTLGTTTTGFVGDHTEWVVGAANQPARYYNAGGMRLATQAAGVMYYPLTDHLGSTTMTTDANGYEISEIRYKAWGETRYTYGTQQTKHTYTGQYSNLSDFGLMYYNARWYDPYLNRWTQSDIIIPDQYDPQSWDRFAYVNNNPVRYNDPSGHCPFCLVAVHVIGAIILTGDTPRTGPGEAENFGDLVIDGLQHEDHAIIVGEGLQSLQQDPSVQAAQGRVVDVITGAPEYGKQAYSPSDISDQFVANGPSGNWVEASITGNQAFWMVRGGTISATDTNVSADGTIVTTWHIQDNFDFLPGSDRSADYNFWATIIHYFYNDLLGAEESFPTDAYWNETTPSQYEDTVH